MKNTYTVGEHPNAKFRSSIFKWAVFQNGQLFEGFIYKDSAERAAERYNKEEEGQ